ncbi:MAG: diaminopropionate ammonia-lyase [Acidimicrobiia bacterium]|nr:diaminopropionate ammonia-lyase [Acidimicrobiia bacterium]
MARPSPSVPATRLAGGEIYVRPTAPPRARVDADARPAVERLTDPPAFHRRLPGYRATPLRRAVAAERRLGVGRLWVKDESQRLGLPAFKMLGVSWALYRTLSERLGQEPEGWRDLDDLARAFALLRPLSLVCATDGNHGRAVARMARLLGLEARVFVPENTVATRVDAIAAEGATVTVVAGTYDEAVSRAAEESDRPGALLASDTSWPGYEEFPRRVIEGYATIFAEIEDEMAADGARAPDVVAVQIGVGALATAVVDWYGARPGGAAGIIGVEPTRAACVLESLRAGEIVHLEGGQDSIMAGLNCGTPSLLAWPVLAGGLAACVAIDDDRARAAVRLLAADGVESGESGAAGLGGLLEIVEGPLEQRTGLGLEPGASVLVISTEGPTDPAAWEAIVGRRPACA